MKAIYKGTSEVRKIKTNLLVRKYERFTMKPEENISEMYARLSEITDSLESLKKEYSNQNLVKKVLRSLTPPWHIKAAIIEDSNDLTILVVDQLIRSLMTYEINIMKSAEEESKKKKIIALKAYPESSEESDGRSSMDSDEEELMALITRRARRYFRKARKEGNFPRKFLKKNANKKGEPSKKEEIIFYECKKVGHMRCQCPEL